MFDHKKHFVGGADVEPLYQSLRNNDLIAIYALPIKEHAGVPGFEVTRPLETIDLTELLALQSICKNTQKTIVQFETYPCETNSQRPLSANQKQVLIGLAKGMDDKTISRPIGLSEHTIAVLQEQMLDMLGAKNAPHAIILALIANKVSLKECTTNHPTDHFHNCVQNNL